MRPLVLYVPHMQHQGAGSTASSDHTVPGTIVVTTANEPGQLRAQVQGDDYEARSGCVIANEKRSPTVRLDKMTSPMPRRT